MDKRVVINPAYTQFLSFVEELPNHFSDAGEIIYQGRNELRVFRVNGVDLVVKSFRIPHLINQVVYASFRSSKSCRSYEHAHHLIKEGFRTPTPIAYVETRCCGLFRRSYYVTLKAEDSRLLREFVERELEGREYIVTQLGVFLGKLHESGIYHEDFSPGNVLFDVDAVGEAHFSLVDINRMSFGPVSETQGYHAFRRLNGSNRFYELAATSYAELRGFDTQFAVAEVKRRTKEFFIGFRAHQARKAKYRKWFGSK